MDASPATLTAISAVVSEETLLSIYNTAMSPTGANIGDTTASVCGNPRTMPSPDLQKLIRECRFVMNQSTIVSLLPTEILSLIFLFLVEEYHELDRITWIVITHVCSRWRSVTLGYPKLWTRPYFFHPECAREMIQRARSLPLTVVLNTLPYMWEGADVMKSALAAAAKSLPSTETLIIRDFGGDDWYADSAINQGIVQEVLARQPAPILHTLQIEVYKFLEVDLPSDLFVGSSSPRLEHLVLRNCVLPLSLDGQHFVNVTSLEITILETFGDPQLDSVEHTVDVLGRLPALQRLSLFDVFPEDGYEGLSSAESPPRTVEFQHLKFLSLTGPSEGCRLFIESITYPPTARVSVESISISSDAPQVNRHLIGALLSRTSLVHLADFRWNHGDCTIDLASNGQDHPLLQVTIPYHAGIIAELYSVLPWEDIHTVTYRLPYSTAQTWFIIGQAPKLHTLHVEGLHPHLFPVLSCSIGRLGSRNPSPSFPGLHYLALDRCLVRHVSIDAAVAAKPISQAGISYLLDTLLRRRRAGYGPSDIKLIACMKCGGDVSPYIIGTLKQFGIRIQCNFQACRG